MKIIRKKLSEDELQPPNTRYDADCDCIQQTYDGGTTWVDAPLQDPRTSPMFLRPPLDLSDSACEAASGIVENFHDSLDSTITTINGGANAVGVGNLVANILLDITGIGLLISLLIEFGSIIISIGTTGVAAAFTSTVFDQLLCIFVENMGTNGQVSAAQFANIQAAISSTFGALSDVNVVMQGWLAPLGYVGLSNIGVLFAQSGDCSSCTFCFEHVENFTGGVEAYTTIADPSFSENNGGRYGGVYDAVNGHTLPGCASSNSVSPFTDAQQVTVVIDMGEACDITNIAWWTLCTTGNYNVYLDFYADDGSYIGNRVHEHLSVTGWQPTNIAITTPNVRYVNFGCDCGLGQACRIDDITISV